MNKTLTKKERTVIDSIIKKYSSILLLNHFTIKLKEGTEHPESLAECVFTYPYLNGILKVNVEKIRQRDQESWNHIICHELCHLVTDPLYDKAISRYVTKDEISAERERLTDHIANLIIKNNL